MKMEENNKLIDDFMGKPYDYVICDACGKINPELDNPDSGSRITKCCPRSIGNYGKTYRPDDASIATFKYHTSWDWLMPVVEKISAYAYEDGETSYPRTFGMPFTQQGAETTIMVRFNRRQVFHGKDLLSACYDACIDFIQWYNTQPTKS